MNGASTHPSYVRLGDHVLRARLITIRDAITPILATNNLPHFTDHSVNHSDHLCITIDELTSPLGAGEGQLNDIEAFVVYAACYLHDIGMQHQNAGETQVIMQALSDHPFQGQRWRDLAIETRRTLLRDHHHRVSHEMVRSSINAVDPIIGIQLSNADHAGYIGCLCEAHCVTPGTDQYKALLSEGPRLRMGLLAALLRLADILDESRRRTQLYRERTVELDVTSRMHWWRHYYVADVTFNPSERSITVWFDFPPDRRAEYNTLVPELQIPFLQEEISHQQLVLGRANLLWSLDIKETPPTSSDAIAMPDEVHMRMAAELTARRQHDAQVDLHAVLSRLQESRPLVKRQLDALRSHDQQNLPPDDYLRRVTSLAQQLWDIGGRRDAWMLLHREQDRMKALVSPVTALKTGILLGRMMLDDRAPDLAFRAIDGLQASANTLDKNDPVRIDWLRLFAETLVEQSAYSKTVEVIGELLQLLQSGTDQLTWKARLAEVHMLQGELDAADGLICSKDER